ncbi:hypothetical protein FACS1894211_06840 [Clostridia bacterium]|nr:hypothetical protein FACS1894211_06840 [Clostridia bacterium]
MIDVYSKGEYPANVLSNFYPNAFGIDGIKCRSMESFLQSLKYKNICRQREVCALAGKIAKRNALAKKWFKKQVLWWRGVKMKRDGEAYQAMLRRAYGELAKNPVFAKALADSGNEPLTHSIGKQNPKETILTEVEFVGLLTELRERLDP